MSLVRTDPHLWCMLVGLSSVTWTLIPYGWYYGSTAGPLRQGLILGYLSGEACGVALLDCPVCRCFGIRARFEGLGDGPRQVHRPWKVSTESPALPDMSSVTDRRWSSSPCLNLDELSSSDDDTVGSVCLSDLSVTLLCGSVDGHSPVNSDQVLSDVDLPPETVSDDKRQVIRIRDVSPDVQIVDISVGLGIPDGQCPRVARVNGCHYPCAFRP